MPKFTEKQLCDRVVEEYLHNPKLNSFTSIGARFRIDRHVVSDIVNYFLDTGESCRKNRPNRDIWRDALIHGDDLDFLLAVSEENPGWTLDQLSVCFMDERHKPCSAGAVQRTFAVWVLVFIFLVIKF
jgi:hypothetical protein